MTTKLIPIYWMRALCVPVLGGLTVLWSGCYGGPVNLPAEQVTENVSFSQQIQPIFDQRCTVCHVLGGFALGFVSLELTEGDSRAMLVGQASSQDAAHTLVVPGDSSLSLLFLKVSSNDPPVGATMPLFGGERLSSEELALMRDWIDQGALDN